MVNQNKLADDLFELAALRDEDIDTSEICEVSSFDEAERGRYSDLKVRNYDVRSIANWCLVKARHHNISATNMWLNKLVYFIYERALLDLNAVLTSARLEAWDYGPVFRELYLNFPNTGPKTYYRFNVKTRSRELAMESFEAEDVEVFEKVWNDFGRLSAAQLTRMTHQPGTAWSAVWEKGGKVNPGMVIDIKAILGREFDHEDGRD